MAEESSLPVRERLLAAAAVLFYEQGIAATGIDSITKRAYLQVRHQEWLDLYAKRLQAAATPQAGVLAVFAAYQDHAERAYEHGFRGCGLLNAAAELPVGADGRDIVRAHKEQVEQILHSHLQALFSDRHTVKVWRAIWLFYWKVRLPARDWKAAAPVCSRRRRWRNTY